MNLRSVLKHVTSRSKKAIMIRITIMLALALFAFSSCSIFGVKETDDTYTPGPEMEGYVAEFIKLSNGAVSKDDIKDLSIEIVPLESSIAGICYTRPLSKLIKINQEVWAELSIIEKKGLIFHELGHCVLKRMHSEPTDTEGLDAGTKLYKKFEKWAFDSGFVKRIPRLKDGCPGSMMHPSIFSERCLEDNYQYYIEELFDRTQFNKINGLRKPSRSCAETKIVNKTNEWTPQDDRALATSKETCDREYNSCLKTFIKKEPLTYNAICGE